MVGLRLRPPPPRSEISVSSDFGGFRLGPDVCTGRTDRRRKERELRWRIHFPDALFVIFVISLTLMFMYCSYSAVSKLTIPQKFHYAESEIIVLAFR
jgi:hypothetical protein